jgi:hypothetical protein
MSIKSQPYFLLDIPTVSDVKGRFKYHYFTTGETVYPADQDSTLDQRTKAAFGIPRKIIIELEDNIRELSSDIKISQRVVQEIIKISNLSKAEAEAQLQNKNASRLTFNVDNEFIENIYQHPDFDSANDHFDMAVRLLNNVDQDSQDILSRVLENTNIPGPIEFDPSTNLPVVDFDEQRAALKTTSVIMDYALGDLVSSITNDRLSSFSDDFMEFEKKAKERQSESRKNQKYGVFNLGDYSMSIEPLDKSYISKQAVIPIGFILYKTRVEGDQRIPEDPIILINPNKKTVEDHSVIYGATYEYSVHTLALASSQDADSRNKYYNFLLLSKDSKKIVIECEERKPPPPPNDVNFNFLDSSMLINWQLPIETDEKLIAVNDIKYVQIFKRSSIQKPFSLIRMYDFNDSLQVVPLEEYIPPERIKLTFQTDTSLEVDLPDKGEYCIYTVACVDAHGNSSFLGPQFAVYLDSLNQPKIDHIAYPGSPKQYPNMTVLNDAFEDSIRVSGYNKLTFYHNPEFTVLLNQKNRQNLVSAQKSIASYILQLIDVETQVDEVIEIFMRQN